MAEIALQQDCHSIDLLAGEVFAPPPRTRLSTATTLWRRFSPRAAKVHLYSSFTRP